MQLAPKYFKLKNKKQKQQHVMRNTLSNQNQNSYVVKNNTAPHTPQMTMYNNIATMHKADTKQYKQYTRIYLSEVPKIFLMGLQDNI